MSDESSKNPGNVRKLSDAIHRVRTAETERSDVVVELRDAERARLEILADELKSVFDEVPAEDEQFIFTVAPGLPPRLWIDMTSFVVLGRDRRTYRFLKDTRLGRTIIKETDDLPDMADTVTTYVAERIIERERAVESEWVAQRLLRETGEPPTRGSRAVRPRDEAAGPSASLGGVVRNNLAWLVAAFMGGLLIGVLALLGTAWVVVG